MATYIPNATQVTEPTASRTVESAALEFRTLKAHAAKAATAIQADGTVVFTATQSMGGNKLTSLANGSATQDAATVGQVVSLIDGASTGLIALLVEKHVATAAQTVFNLTTFSYLPAGRNLLVFINGLLQDDDAAYTESSPTQIVFTEGLTAGDVVRFVKNAATTSNVDLALRTDLASTDAGKGAGQIGVGVANDYPDDTIGFLVVKNTSNGYNALRGFNKAEQALIQAETSTSDHAAVLNAMLSTERHLYLPRGTWRTSTGFTESSYDHMEGAGIGLSNILVTADVEAIRVLGSFCKNEGFTVKKTGTHTKSGIVNGSAAVKADRNIFRDIISEGFGSHGVEMVNGNICHFYNVHGQLNTGWGLYFARTVGIVDNHGHHIDASCNWNGNTGGGVSLTTGTATADATAPKAISGRLNTQNNTGPGIYIGTTRNDFIVYSEANFGGDVTKQCILDTYAIGNKIHSLEGAVYGNVAGVAGSLDGNIVTMSNGFADYRSQTKGKHTFSGGSGKGLRIYLDDATAGIFDLEKTTTREMRSKYAGSTGIWNHYHEHSTPGTEVAQRFEGRLFPIGDSLWDFGASTLRWLMGHFNQVRFWGAPSGATNSITIGYQIASTVGATGAAAALPAQPLGYIVMYVGTTQVKVPYYNA